MLTKRSQETIAAPITAPGQAAVSIVRISGPGCVPVLRELLRNSEPLFSHPRELCRVDIVDSAKDSSNLAVLDQALGVFFPAPNSFTGEDCAELHLHGSPYLVSRLLEILAEFGVCAAAPGEFSQRAFVNGKIDLAQAEAIADLIAAESEVQARVATEQLKGRLSEAVGKLAEPLREILAEVEAQIDFPEEGLEESSDEEILRSLQKVLKTVSEYSESYSAGKICREGANVVLAGLPNAGKSSLLNLLAEEKRAIVNHLPGTTRDTIELRMSINGLLIRVWDTAGLVEADEFSRKIDPVEREGIEISLEKIDSAQLVLFVLDAANDLDLQIDVASKVGDDKPWLLVVNKADLLSEQEQARLIEQLEERLGGCDTGSIISSSQKQSIGNLQEWKLPVGAGFKPALTNEERSNVPLCQDRPKAGLCHSLLGQKPLALSALDTDSQKPLKAAIYSALVEKSGQQAALLICNARHRECLLYAQEALKRALKLLSDRQPLEFLALEIRDALGGLSDIVGITTSEDILERIFARFCIGK